MSRVKLIEATEKKEGRRRKPKKLTWVNEWDKREGEKWDGKSARGGGEFPRRKANKKVKERRRIVMGIGKSTKKKMLRRLGAQKLAKMMKMGRGRGEGRGGEKLSN